MAADLEPILDSMDHLMAEARATPNPSYAIDCNMKLMELCEMIHFEMTQRRRRNLIAELQDLYDADRHEEATHVERMIEELSE